MGTIAGTNASHCFGDDILGFLLRTRSRMKWLRHRQFLDSQLITKFAHPGNDLVSNLAHLFGG